MANDELRSAFQLQPSPQAMNSQTRFSRAQSPRIPSHIPLPPPPTFTLFSSSPTDLSPQYHTAPSSPAVQFYTPPTSPLIDLFSAQPKLQPQFQTLIQPQRQPLSLNVNIPPSPTNITDEPFATVNFFVDPAIEDDGLSTLEKIYLFSTSKHTFHRVFIVHALPDFLQHVTSQEAIKYVLPLLNGLAVDEEDEQVQEALAAELVPVIWWFLTNCTLISDDDDDGDNDAANSSSTTSAIPVQAFRLILATLLLSSSTHVGSSVRQSIVHLLTRLRHADEREDGKEIAGVDDQRDHDHHSQADWVVGSFGRGEREMFRSEILQQVVIGMGRLNDDMEDFSPPLKHEERAEWSERDSERNVQVVTGGDQGVCVSSVYEAERARLERAQGKVIERVNPYFPVEPRQYSIPSPASSAGSTPSPDSTTDTSGSSSSSSSSPGTAPILARKEGLTSSPLVHFTPPELNRTFDVPILSPPISQSSSFETVLPGMGGQYSFSSTEKRFGTYASEEGDEDEQAAAGRLSSMSLMAAVTASGLSLPDLERAYLKPHIKAGILSEDMKEAFVKEVVRAGQDEVHWVRSEASYALGALAKVVPEELVISSLLPSFERLRRDTAWQVRQSTLFALPAILSRLRGIQRRQLALDAVETLWADKTDGVRRGVLEALGEVIYSFYGEEAGPPEELVEIFLGRREAKGAWSDEERTLVCGFNYPAVALTMGRERWEELREVYVEISRNGYVKVQRTLSASLGELAKIIGREHTERDLVRVWWDGIRSEWEEVRQSAADSVEGLVKVVCQEVGEDILNGVVGVWDEGLFVGWRERESIVKKLVRSEIVKRGLLDSIAAVRTAALSHLTCIPDLHLFLNTLKSSHLFQRRMTFIACYQALANINLDDLSSLADDPVVGVRIALARLVGSSDHPIAARLSQDTSEQVRSYVINKHNPSSFRKNNVFSRPPPVPS